MWLHCQTSPHDSHLSQSTHKPVCITPDIKDERNDPAAFLNTTKCKLYQSAVGKALWIAICWADIQFPPMKCAHCWRECHDLASAVTGEPVRITCWVDSAWAGFHVSRRSCSGGLLALTGAIITSSPPMQATPALNSCVAELFAIRSGFVETLSVNHLEEELGHDVRAEVRTHSQVARSVVHSEELCKMKHIELWFLFVQEVTKRGEISNSRDRTQAHPAT